MPGLLPATRRRLLVAGFALMPLASAKPKPVPAPAPPLPQATIPLTDALTALNRFVGIWHGNGDGNRGNCGVDRSYQSSVGGRFLRSETSYAYIPQPGQMTGELRSDLGLFGYDEQRLRVTLAQFHSEGVVIRYLATGTDLAGDRLEFESDIVENLPIGTKARSTIVVVGPDAFEETLELAQVGRDYDVYAHNRLVRS